jgi:hypothetical protein
MGRGTDLVIVVFFPGGDGDVTLTGADRAALAGGLIPTAQLTTALRGDLTGLAAMCRP